MKPLGSWLPQWVESRLWNTLQHITRSVSRHGLTSHRELLWCLLFFYNLHIVMLDHLVAFCVSWSEPSRDQVVRPAELSFMRQNPFKIANETISVCK